MLYHGDCLEVMRTLPDASVDAVITDPPYGTTACKWDSPIPFAPMWEQLKRITKKHSPIVLFGSQPFTSALVMSNPKMFRYEWVWHKTRAAGFMNAPYMPLKTHENVLVFSAAKVKPNQFTDSRMQYFPQGIIPDGTLKPGKQKKVTAALTGRGPIDKPYIAAFTNYPRTIIALSSEACPLHPTQKPVALLDYLIRTYTNPGDTVLDFTMGSGTTGVAARSLGRNFIGIEQDAGYFAIAEQRIREVA